MNNEAPQKKIIDEPRFHGTGVGFYRCVLCSAPNAPWELKKNGACRKCGHTRVRPTTLSLSEKIVQIFRYPAVWKWN